MPSMDLFPVIGELEESFDQAAQALLSGNPADYTEAVERFNFWSDVVAAHGLTVDEAAAYDNVCVRFRALHIWAGFGKDKVCLHRQFRRQAF